jgi:tRNA threonylcarbamoyl adenosine modification protein (Sua5/YciO/YrdC/YwlC family)
MYIRLHPQNPEERKLKEIITCLKDGGIIIYPTDTVYGIGCDIYNAKAIEKLYRIKGVNEKTAQFSFITNTISDFSKYAKSLDNATFRQINKCLPGAYTFILEASKEVPKLLKTKKNTVGLRIPNNIICQAIVTALGNPIISTSLPEHDNVESYTEPEIFGEFFNNQVDLVIDGGLGSILASTVIKYENGNHEIIREGLGDISPFE